ncbi:hypothetical protein POVWA2_005300 [Plasmodium ovale wallikeri]|uniref:Uncharacterized protein n=1 Tax=Plasmodium ovale wallikeri TaxID=864142 RepID=A0A1A8YJF4_PLAOA|nr:hypothetical protein POVWA1_005220 [Plasmodium ovale wallikeri]SBT31665.1 hypothetical protein POVWA2_005300 [Plasmodium ovale wallikeri]
MGEDRKKRRTFFEMFLLFFEIEKQTTKGQCKGTVKLFTNAKEKAGKRSSYANWQIGNCTNGNWANGDWANEQTGKPFFFFFYVNDDL